MNNTRGFVSGSEVSVFLETLQKTQNYKFHLLAITGIYTGLRISDLLKLKYCDFRASSDCLSIKEQKTGKTRQIAINDELRAYVSNAKKRYGRRERDYMFTGRSGNKPMHRTTAYRHIKAAADQCGFNGIATHSLRKTFAIEAYRAEKGDIKKVSEIMNHKYTDTTMNHYILCNFDLNDFLREMLLKRT